MAAMMTVKEAAEVLRLSDQTVWRYVKEGKVNGRKVGRRYLIPAGDIDALLTTNTADELTTIRDQRDKLLFHLNRYFEAENKTRSPKMKEEAIGSLLLVMMDINRSPYPYQEDEK